MAGGIQRWLIEVAIVAKLKADHGKLGNALEELVAEDPSLGLATDQESGQTILKGVSELHLDEAIDRLMRTYRLKINVGAPQVAFQERVTRQVEHSYTFKKQTAGTGEFAAVSIVVQPNDGKGYEFESKITDGAVPEQYIPAIERGIEDVLKAGVVAGFPVVDVKVQLVDGKHHDTDSSSLAFEIAARASFREALQLGGSVILEPIMLVEVVTPADIVRPIVDDLKLRRGQIRSQEAVGITSVVIATVPLMNMLGYVNSLRVTSLGRATIKMQFSHYAQAPSPDDDPSFGSAVGMRA